MNSGTIKIELIVDDKGSVRVKQFGTTTDKSLKKTGKSISDVDKKTQSWLKSWKGMGVIAGAAATAVAYKLQALCKEFVSLANVQEAVETRVAAVIRSTGQAAGFNVIQMTEMASAYQGLTTTGDEVILSGQAILATFKKIRGEGFGRATMAALDMSEVMQQDLKSSIVMIGKALNDPIANLSAMTRAGVQFTDSQRDMIKELWAAGKTMDAQNIILLELESQFGGAAKAARENFGGATKAATNALGDMKEELGFVITKSEFFIDVAKDAEETFIKWTEAIKEHQGEIENLAINLYKIVETTGEWALKLADISLIVSGIKPGIWFTEWLDGTHAVRRETEEWRKELERLKKVLEATGKTAAEVYAEAWVKAYEEKVRAWGAAAQAEEKLTKKREKQLENLHKALQKSNSLQLQAIHNNKKWAESTIKATKISAAEYDRLFGSISDHEEMRLKTLERFQDDFEKSTTDQYTYEKSILDQRYQEYDKYITDKDALNQWYASERYRLWKKSDQQSAIIFKNIETNWKSSVNDMVDAFVAGENMKQSVAEITKNMLVSTASSIAREMFAQAIGKICELIGAQIGLGASGAGAQGSMKGGVWGALAEIGMYLGTGVAAMLAGRAMGSQFRAKGGWIETHPYGGTIREGSGMRDDVFLGYTPGTRHWGMGGEYVINKESTRRHRQLIELINADRGMATGGYLDRRYGAGDYVDYKGTQIPWHPAADALALGGMMSFMHGIPKGLIGALIELAMFFATAVPMMFAGKYLGDKFSAGGGMIDEYYGLGRYVKKARRYLRPDKIVKTAADKLTDKLRGQRPDKILADKLREQRDWLRRKVDPTAAWAQILELIRTPLEQVARDLVTPKKYYSDPLKGLSRIVDYMKDVGPGGGGDLLPPLHTGTPYVPRTGPYWLEQGERVIDKETNQGGGGGDTHVHFHINPEVFAGENAPEYFARMIEEVIEHRIGKQIATVDLSTVGLDI